MPDLSNENGQLYQVAGGKIKVLVVDDEKLIRWSLTKGLEGAGYAVDTAVDGEDAVQLMASSKYDIVVTDLKMPGLSGIDLLKKIKEYEHNLPVIFLSAYLSKEVIDDAIHYGAYSCVSKPFQMDNILHIIKDALEFRSNQGQCANG